MLVTVLKVKLLCMHHNKCWKCTCVWEVTHFMNSSYFFPGTWKSVPSLECCQTAPEQLYAFCIVPVVTTVYTIQKRVMYTSQHIHTNTSITHKDMHNIELQYTQYRNISCTHHNTYTQILYIHHTQRHTTLNIRHCSLQH